MKVPMLALSCTLLLAPAFAQALQEIKVKDGDSVKVTLSSRDPTRITVSRGRLDKIIGPKGVLEIQADKERGDIFVKPMAGAPESVSFFVRDDGGATYTLVATQRPVPGDTIVLTSNSARRGIGRGAQYLSTPFVERVKRLVKAMALGEDLDSYGTEEQKRPVALWKETDITLVKSYSTTDLYGEVYVITNVSATDLKFHEREFMEFGDRVQAVALERLTLRPKESTFLYVVRRSVEGGEGVN